MLDSVFDAFARKSPVTVMGRGMMERVFNLDQLNEWFENTAEVRWRFTMDNLLVRDWMIGENIYCG